ncbi:envelope biogenesis factor ElyC [Desulfoplanes sp.]
MDLFVLKKLVSRLFFPVPLCLELLVLGLILLLTNRGKKAATVLMATGAGLLLILSLQGPSCLLLRPLETMYPPAFMDHNGSEELPHIDWIVVLGGGTVPAENRPPNSRLAENSLSRVVEGVRLSRIFPRAGMVFTGVGSPGDTDSTASKMAQAAMVLGVDGSRITRIGRAKDTPDEARLCAERIPRDDYVILVTSASHLHRALRLFIKQGLSPVPAPAGYLCKTTPEISYQDFIPSAYNLVRSERAIYEYMGLAWASFRGLI